MRTEKPVYYTAAELTARGSSDIPRELVSTTHLIYSSPATLAFNSPGAEGYGVKRAGLAVPGSVMLIVSPGCCGRNTSAISRMPGYEDRFFYLTMDETDLVTGRHLKKIPRAVAELCRGLEQQDKRPRVVMICITCVDALLGTDMERICRRAQEKVPGVRVQPCYMYALTREGRKPPMVHVRQSIYELLEPRKKRASSVNLLGFFAPLEGSLAWNTADGKKSSYTGSELLPVLGQAGVRRIRQIGACPDYDAFQEMAEANFNIVLNPEARPAAYDLQERLGIPFIEMSRFYQIDRIEAQYAALGRVLQTQFDDSLYKKEAEEAVDAFRASFPDAVFSVGEAMNGNPFELACALVRQGFEVREIFGTVNKDSYVWLGILDRLSPQTRIYSNLHPSMLHYSREEAAASGVTICIGRDAAWYHPEAANVQWITDVQPFGYRAVTGLFRALKVAMETGGRGSYSSDVSLGAADIVQPACTAGRAELFEGASAPVGFRRFTTPFAPDQSGAVSVLYDMGGICVICDAGGCTGNICGFDEPRWFGSQSAVFSAGLRDMDAILGRDDKLVEKLADAARMIPASFAAIVGTPVPAVIGKRQVFLSSVWIRTAWNTTTEDWKRLTWLLSKLSAAGRTAGNPCPVTAHAKRLPARSVSGAILPSILPGSFQRKNCASRSGRWDTGRSSAAVPEAEPGICTSLRVRRRISSCRPQGRQLPDGCKKNSELPGNTGSPMQTAFLTDSPPQCRPERPWSFTSRYWRMPSAQAFAEKACRRTAPDFS